jgi:hypothetical protein
MSGWTPPQGDEGNYPLTAVLKFEVVAKKKLLRISCPTSVAG